MLVASLDNDWKKNKNKLFIFVFPLKNMKKCNKKSTCVFNVATEMMHRQHTDLQASVIKKNELDKRGEYSGVSMQVKKCTSISLGKV